MALQAGVSTSKVLVLVGAGLTGSIVLSSGRLSELISQLQEILKGVDDSEITSKKFDSAFLAAQIRQLAKEIRELSASDPITIYNGGSSCTGGFASYLVPATALGVMGYCYMWWKGWSFSDVMFVTKHNMVNAVATVSKQLENVSETLAVAKRHLSKRLDSLDWKLEEQKDLSNLITNDVKEMNSNLSQIGFEVESIHQIVSGLERKMDLIESNQDSINYGLLSLCPAAKRLEDLSAKQGNPLRVTFEEKATKGLQFLSEAERFPEIEEPATNGKLCDPTVNSTAKKGELRWSFAIFSLRMWTTIAISLCMAVVYVVAIVKMSAINVAVDVAETGETRPTRVRFNASDVAPDGGGCGGPSGIVLRHVEHL